MVAHTCREKRRLMSWMCAGFLLAIAVCLVGGWVG